MAVAEQTREQTVRAQAKWVHSSARKARLVTDLIRGRSVPEARTILAFSQRAVAHDIEKVLRSAVANAESRPDLLWNGDDLVVVTAYADEGPTLKRWRARARGRVARIRKRTCHITLELAQSPAAVAAAAAAAEAKPRRQRAPKAEPAAESRDRDRDRDRDRRDDDSRAERPTGRSGPRGRAAQAALPQEDRERGQLVGQKIHPGGMRVGVIHDWKSNWYTGPKEFPAYLLEDIRIREHIYKKLSHAGLSDILIRKDKQRITVDIYTARPGIVIGKSGVEVDALRKELHAITQKNVHININEIKRPELDAKLVAQSIAEQLSNRVAFRRAMKRALASAIRSGAAGVKIQCSGRLGGGEMSRRETYNEGRVPLHTIRADIDYGFVEAKTTYGRIGVKVWINKGEIMPEGFEGVSTGDQRLGDQDARRRRGGATEGLGASRESGRGRGPDREGLGPVKRRRGPGGGGAGGRRRRWPRCRRPRSRRQRRTRTRSRRGRTSRSGRSPGGRSRAHSRQAEAERAGSRDADDGDDARDRAAGRADAADGGGAETEAPETTPETTEGES